METTNIILAFPNSGNTWLRFILNNLGVKLEVDYITTQQGTGHKEMLTFKQIVSYIEKYPNKFHNNNILFLHRDPRDTIVSSYFHITRRFLMNYDGGLPVFLRDPRNGLEKCIQFNLYMKEEFNHPKDKIDFISYDQLHNSPKEALSKVLNLFQVERSEEDIYSSVKNSSVEIMKVEELKINRKLKLTRPEDPESFKTRRGIMGGYVDYLSEEDIKYCNDLLEQYNYFERML